MGSSRARKDQELLAVLIVTVRVKAGSQGALSIAEMCLGVKSHVAVPVPEPRTNLRAWDMFLSWSIELLGGTTVHNTAKATLCVN